MGDPEIDSRPLLIFHDYPRTSALEIRVAVVKRRTYLSILVSAGAKLVTGFERHLDLSLFIHPFPTRGSSGRRSCVVLFLSIAMQLS